jgi:uncharacterized protein (TIGR00255 family)
LLRSMTGHGAAQVHENDLFVAVELRAVNNRYFKCSVRATEGYLALESRVEATVRHVVRRGTIYANLRVDREPSPDDFRLNLTVVKSYWDQLQNMGRSDAQSVRIDALLALPGVVTERSATAIDAEADWPVIEKALRQALAELDQMRDEEGRAMAEDLNRNGHLLLAALQQIERRAPDVVASYQQRLQTRLNALLAEYDVKVESADVVREVGLFAERCDISEECVRLRSHLEQFTAIMDETESGGRKLEFLIQEMFRETNTIGSKANDAEIEHRGVDVKNEIERLREQVDNV